MAASIDLVLIGFGHVTRRFVRLLDEQRLALARQYGCRCRIVGIATGRHGRVLAGAGLDPLRAAHDVEGGGQLFSPLASPLPDSQTLIREAAARSHSNGRPLVVVETTPLDVDRGQPAIDHVRTALEAGAHVITANKGPVAFAYHDLSELARTHGRLFRFESTVMDGIPIFNLIRQTLPAVRVTGFRGVINSTTNYILSAMEQGREHAEALAEMQAAGIAEADASLDVNGWDAAAKTAALANVLLDARITPRDVRRQGISSLTMGHVAAARRRGRRFRLVARATRLGEGVEGSVAPEEVPDNDHLAGLRGTANALAISTDLLGTIVITQLDGGLTQTAYGLLADLIDVATAIRSAPT